jgi:hypothetical protein
MAIPTPVNGQITDTISQSNLTVVGEAPSLALGSLYQVYAHAAGLMMENAVNAQQQVNITAQAATAQGVAMLFSTGATFSAKLAQSDVPDNMLSLLTALRAASPSSN